MRSVKGIIIGFLLILLGFAAAQPEAEAAETAEPAAVPAAAK